MKEELRLEKLQNIKRQKEEMKILKQKFSELKKLEKNESVKRYLKLKNELEKEKILTLEEIKSKEMTISRTSCNHDIWFFRGGYRVEYDYGPESRDSYYYEIEEDKIEFYFYYCLECWEQIEVKKSENEKFLKEHNVIKLNKRFINIEDYIHYQKLYYDLLYTNTTEKAYQKLLKY